MDRSQGRTQLCGLAKFCNGIYHHLSRGCSFCLYGLVFIVVSLYLLWERVEGNGKGNGAGVDRVGSYR